GDKHPDTILATESDEFIKSNVESLVVILSEFEGIPDNMCDVPFHDNSLPLDVSKDQFEYFPILMMNLLRLMTIPSLLTTSSMLRHHLPTLSSSAQSILENLKTYTKGFCPPVFIFSTSLGNHMPLTSNELEASPPNSELVSSEVMENVIPEVGGIDDDILLTIKDYILREKLLNINLLIANIEALDDNPTPSSDFMTKSSSTSLNSLLEDTSTFDTSLPELETFCFDLEEISSGSNTTRSDISLPEYEAFYDDHVKEISSGSTTTHFDSSLYDSFIFDLLINPFPHADRSDFYEFADELTHIISLPEYDCFFFKNEPNSWEFHHGCGEGYFSNKSS
nr:hypothetical protein [Tanacetum cinerariifolium]